MTDVPHPLQTLLHFLVTDASTVTHLQYILDNISTSCIAPSTHLQKWLSRVTSLIHSKDPAARWAAMCIAYKMSTLSKSLLVDNAQSWAGSIFPSLSKPEPVPILRAAIRYLTLLLCAAGHNLEFQRQVAIPMVPKVSSALLTIADTHHDKDIKVSCIQSLTQLVPLYPSLHKALFQRLFSLCHSIFGGSGNQTTVSLLDATVNLYAVLHFIGGKFTWSAWLALRITYPTSAQHSHKAVAYLRSSDRNLPDFVPHTDTTASNPLATVVLNLEKLKCGISAIIALLRVPVSRPVKVPVGHLAILCWCLLTSASDDEGQGHFDVHARLAESTVVPQIWVQACRMLSCLVQTAQELLAPHASRLIIAISSRLEDDLQPSQKHLLLQCVYDLLYFCPVFGPAFAINRLMKATIPLLSPLYLLQPWAGSSPEASGQSKAGKKRRREFEADNALSVTNVMVCGTTDDCETLMVALDVVQQCMLNVELAPSTRSLASRVLLSILLSLPSIPPSTLSSDPSFSGRVIKKVQDMCIECIQETSHAMSQGICLVLRSFSSENLAARDKLNSLVDLLLHPRRPPFVRALPFIESLSLSSAEESAEETTTRQSLNLVFSNGETGISTCEPQINSEPAKHTSLDQQAPLNPLQERVSATSIEQYPQAKNDNSPTKAPVTSVVAVAPPKQVVPDPPTKPVSPISPKEPTLYVVPMSIDESDHEEIPSIDLGSDSDA